MNTKLERNLTLMMVHSIFLEPLFWGPILILAIQKLGHMPLQEFYFMEAVCVIALLIIDIPTGALADIIGRKKMLIIGQSFLFISFTLFAFMSAQWHVWAANLVWAVGAAFRSGADKALIQESCIALGKEEGYYRRYAGKAQGYRLFLFAVCAPFTSWIATFDLRLPLLMSIPSLLIPLFITFLLTEPPREERRLSTKEHVRQMKDGVVDMYKDKRIMWIMLYLCVIGVVSKIWFYTYNPYFERVGLPLYQFGYVFFAFNVIAGITSHYGHVVEEKLGDKATVHLLLPLLGVPIILMSLIPLPFMAYMTMFQNVVRGMHGPFFDNMSKHYLRNSTRATVLSAQSSVMSAVSVVGLFGFSILLESNGLLVSLGVLGILTLVAHVILMKQWKKHF